MYAVPAHRSGWIVGLFLLFLAEAILLGIAPLDRVTWALENLLVLVGVLLLVISWRRFPLSSPSYGLILAFLAVHEVGSHYTYSQVPYDEWCRSITGSSLNEILSWERNHFDRAVHLLWGLLLAWPIRELALRAGQPGRIWSHVLPILLTLAASALYELVEWSAASLFAPEIGLAYVGAQGDVWDSHRDMALAGFGALLTMGGALAATHVRGAQGATSSGS